MSKIDHCDFCGDRMENKGYPTVERDGKFIKIIAREMKPHGGWHDTHICVKCLKKVKKREL